MVACGFVSASTAASKHILLLLIAIKCKPVLMRWTIIEYSDKPDTVVVVLAVAGTVSTFKTDPKTRVRNRN